MIHLHLIRPSLAASKSLLPMLILGLALTSQLSPSLAEGLERIKYNNPGLAVDLGVGLWPVPVPMDYDGDGDNDLVVVATQDVPDGYIYFFENPGGKTKMPVFKPGVRIADKHTRIWPSYYQGRPHLLIPGKELVDFKETAFSKAKDVYPPNAVHTTEGKIRGNLWGYVDYEGDGDRDIFVGIGDWADYGWDNAFDENGRWTQGPIHGFVYLLLNQGQQEQPSYAPPVKVQAGENPVDVFGYPAPNFADFDRDGDLDLLCGEFVDRMTYFENIGSRKKPRYTEGRLLTYNDEVLRMDECMITPVAYDWDKDGDVDLVVGQVDGRIALVENTGEMHKGMPQFLPPKFFEQEADDVMFGALATPVSFDWDADGDEDLLCGNSSGYIGFFENLDGGNPPKWAEAQYLQANGETLRIQAGYSGSIQGPAESKWGYTTFSVADWNHDGLPDLVVNSIWGKVVWYCNNGTRTNPQLALARPIKVEWEDGPLKPAWNWWRPEDDHLVTQWRTTPAVIDLTGDGLNDLVMLDHEGYLAIFERTREEDGLKLLPGKRVFQSKDVSWFTHNNRPANDTGGVFRANANTAGASGRRKFCFTDWDGDGRIDLLMNSQNVNFFRNVSGDGDQWLFEDHGMLDDLRLAGHTTSPTVVDWDHNEIPDLLVGAEDGFLYYLENPRDKE